MSAADTWGAASVGSISIPASDWRVSLDSFLLFVPELFAGLRELAVLLLLNILEVRLALGLLLDIQQHQVQHYFYLLTFGYQVQSYFLFH